LPIYFDKHADLPNKDVYYGGVYIHIESYIYNIYVYTYEGFHGGTPNHPKKSWTTAVQSLASVCIPKPRRLIEAPRDNLQIGIGERDKGKFFRDDVKTTGKP